MSNYMCVAVFVSEKALKRAPKYWSFCILAQLKLELSDSTTLKYLSKLYKNTHK